MANLVVTRSGNSILVNFNNYYEVGAIDIKRAGYNSGYITKVHELPTHLVVWGSDNKTWKVVPPGGDTTKGFIVDSIGGVAPTDLDHLYSLINTLFD
jgi:hypothetical protein